MLKNSNDQYGPVAKLMHWAIGLLIVGLTGLGAYMVTLDYYDGWYHDSLSLHKAVGMIVFALVLGKFVWMQVSPEPAYLPSLKPWEKEAAKTVHRVLLVLMLLMPLTGYVISTSAGDGISIFGWFDVPAALVVGEKGRDTAILVHFYLAYGGAVLIAMHIAAALKHHFINKDTTLRRILWRNGS